MKETMERLKIFLRENEECSLKVRLNAWAFEATLNNKRYGACSGNLGNAIEVMDETIQSIKAGKGMPPSKIASEVIEEQAT